MNFFSRTPLSLLVLLVTTTGCTDPSERGFSDTHELAADAVKGGGGQSADGSSCGKGKVRICHVPGGDLSKAQTQCVGSSSVESHLAHGDVACACESAYRLLEDADGDLFGRDGTTTLSCTPTGTLTRTEGDCDDDHDDDADEGDHDRQAKTSGGKSPSGSCGEPQDHDSDKDHDEGDDDDDDDHDEGDDDDDHDEGDDDDDHDEGDDDHDADEGGEACHTVTVSLIEDGGDCDDSSAARNPAAAERPNGLDDDCDGQVDDNQPPSVSFQPAPEVSAGQPLTFTARVGDDNLPPGALTVWLEVDGQRGASPLVPGATGEVTVPLTLSCGSHQLTVIAVDDFGAETRAHGTLVADSAPVVEVFPLGYTETEQGRRVTVEARVSDACDPAEGLSGAWSSSIDGLLASAEADGSGRIVYSTLDLSPGDHVLELSVSDVGGRIGLARLDLTVVPYLCRDDRVVAEYDFEEHDGAAVVDRTDFANDLVLSAGTAVCEGAPGLGAGLRFSGKEHDVWAEDRESLDLDTEVSVETWVWLDSLPTGNPSWYNLLSKGEGNVPGDNRNYALYINNQGRVHWSMSKPDGSGQTDCRYGTLSLTPKRWYHIVVTAAPAEGGRKVIYVDGQVDILGTSCGNTALRVNDDPLLVGHTLEVNNRLQGALDGTRILPCEMTEGQVARRYAALAP